MLLKRVTRAVLALAVAAGLGACTDDEPPVEEPVTPTSEIEEPAPPPTDAGNFSAQTVYFAFDDYTLNMDAQETLNSLADHLKADGSAVVQVEGHCDERGSIEYNLALGERRAQSVKNYLVQLGVDPNRLSTISYGEERPAMDGHDEGSWSRNRRAEFNMSAQ